MLTPKQEEYCKKRAEGLKPTEAYMCVYSVREGRNKGSIAVDACRLEENPKISLKIKELQGEIDDKFTDKVVWNKEKAFEDLEWLKQKAKKQIEETGEISAPCASAILNSVKEQNNMYKVGESENGGGVLGDILKAVRGINND